MECSEPKCRETLIGMINKKVSKMVLLSVTLGIIGSVGYFTVYGLNADAKEKEKVVTNTQDIAVMQVKIDNIEETVERIESKQITKADIIDAIKEVMGK